MIKYQLSNKHAKELRVRGRLIRVALPIDVDEDPPDWIAWAEQRLLMQSGERITSAEPRSLWVCRCRDGLALQGLERVLGQILDTRHGCSDGCLPVSIEVIIVSLSPERQRDKPLMAIRWPGKAYPSASSAGRQHLG